MSLVPIPGTPLASDPTPDRVAPCLKHWADIARGMHSPTWTVWEQETMEALYEYSRRNGASNSRESQNSLSGNVSRRWIHITCELLEHR